MFKIKKRFLTGQSGSIIVIAALSAAVFTMLAGGYLSLQLYESKWAQKNYLMHSARNAAEGGVDFAIFCIKHNLWTGWNAGSDPYTKTAASMQASDGTVLAVLDTEVSNPAGNEIEILAAAQTPQTAGTTPVVQNIRAKVTRGTQLFQVAVFADDSITFNGNAVIDSYDSTQGAYGGVNRFSNGDIGTNGVGNGTISIISLIGNAVVHGDALVGPGGNPSTDIRLTGHAAVMGTVSTLTEPIPMVQISAPSGLVDRGALSVSGGTTTINQSGRYSSISISGGGNINVAGNVTIYVTGNYSISGNGTMNITSGSTCDMYCGGTVSIGGNGVVNQTQNPHNLHMFGTDSCTSFTNSGNGNFHGTVYARNATINITGNGTSYGAFVGNIINNSGNGGIHFDESLGGYIYTQGGLKLKYWVCD